MKNRKILILSIVVILAIGILLFVKMNGKKSIETKNSEVVSSQSTAQIEQSVIEHSSETKVSYSYEKIELTTEELAKYREAIEKAGFDSTLLSDQEIQEMFSKIENTQQEISKYLKNKLGSTIDESEINKARQELKAANIDPDKFHNNEIIEFIKQAKKEKKSIVEIVEKR